MTDSGSSLPVGTVTFLLTDIAGSTRLWQDDPAGAAAAIDAHYKVIDDVVTRHGGFRPQEQGEGDSTVIVFTRASDAVAAALDMQRDLAAEPSTARLRVRAALHTGEALLRDELNYFGEPVNRCARLRGIAHGGQVVLSRVTSDLARDRLPDGASIVDLGVHRLKDLARAEHVSMLTHPDIPSDFPPLTSLDSFTHNLPVELTSFIARDAEVTELKSLLDLGRLVTVTGSGGCGKTRLSLHVAADLLDRFPDGVWFVDLAPLSDPEAVAGHALTAMGLQEGPMQSSAEALTAYLRNRRALVVLDNCEHLIHACAELSEALLGACRDTWILATSREPLGVAGEVIWRVPSLSVPAGKEPEAVESLAQYGAVRLFIERARDARPNFEVTADSAPAIVEICSRLDGIPLAIELAAARVRLMPPQEILAALNDRFRLLTGGARTALPRQKTLEASVDWSFALLSESEKTVLARLFVFAGGFTLDAAEQVCGFGGVSAYEVLEVLTSLADRSLVQVETEEPVGRYRLLETIRQFAERELFVRGEIAEVRARHAHYFLGSLVQSRDALEMGEIEPITRFENSFDNIRSAVDWAFGEKQHPLVLEAAWPLALNAHSAGRMSEARSWIEEALTSEPSDPRIKADALLGLGFILMSRLEIFLALPVTEEALAIHRGVGDDIGIGRSASIVGFCRANIDGSPGATAVLDEALEKGRATSDKLTMIYGLGIGKGWTNVYTDLVAARSYLDETVEILGPARGAISPALILACLACANVLQGRWDAACDRAEQAMFRAETDRNQFAMTMALTARGDARLRLGQIDGSRGDIKTALRICEERQDVSLYQYALRVQAELELECGDLDLARAAAEQAAAMTAKMSPQVHGFATVNLARVLLAQGDRRAASEHIDRLIEVGRSLRFQWSLAAALYLKGGLALSQGDPAEAEDLVAEALQIFHQGQAISGAVDCLETLAEISGGLESWAEATRLMACARALRDETGLVVPVRRKKVLGPLVETLEAKLGDDFGRIWAEGAALDLDGVVGYATRGRGERKRPSSGWASLTPVELQVAGLVAEGLTNPLIGERMFISKRTVQGHVSRILAKLSLSSRAEIAALVAARRSKSG